MKLINNIRDDPKKYIIRSIIVVAVIAVLVLGYIFFIRPWLNQKSDEEQIEQDQQQFMDLHHEYESTVSDEDKPYKFLKRYKNMVGWIKIPKTEFSYPVMYSEQDDGEYYLHRDVHGKYSFCGTPFIDVRCDPSESDNLIIYGHNITRKRHFGYLHYYKDKNFYKKHQDIYYSDETAKHHYEILSVIETTIHSPVYNFIDVGNSDEYIDGLKDIVKSSIYETAVAKKIAKQYKKIKKDPDNRPHLITLSTCRTYAGSDNRLLVIAVELQGGTK